MKCSPGYTVLECTVEQLVSATRANAPSTDWIGYVLTVAAIVASSVLGVLAWRTSRQAAVIARAALQAETKRDQDAYEATFDEGIANLFERIGMYVAEVRDWLRDPHDHSAQAFRFRQRSQPETAYLTVAVEAVRMRSRGADRTVMASVSAFIQGVRVEPIKERSDDLVRLLQWLRRYRMEEMVVGDVVRVMEERTDEMRAARALLERETAEKRRAEESERLAKADGGRPEASPPSTE